MEGRDRLEVNFSVAPEVQLAMVEILFAHKPRFAQSG